MSISTTWLLDPAGRIIVWDLRGIGLSKVLARQLK